MVVGSNPIAATFVCLLLTTIPGFYYIPDGKNEKHHPNIRIYGSTLFKCLRSP